MGTGSRTIKCSATLISPNQFGNIATFPETLCNNMSETVQSEFEREVETYRKAMDALQDTASSQQESLESLDDAMDELKQSVSEMTDAVDEYDEALDEFDAAVVSLGEHAADESPSPSRDTAPSGRPAAGD